MQVQEHPLAQKLKDTPLLFNLRDASDLTTYLEANPGERGLIRKTAIEVLDLAPEGIYRSTAAEGALGYLNRRSRQKRQAMFWNQMAGNFRKNTDNIVVVADGDSWFEHPFLEDIIDHLNRRKNVAVFSLASGGDWLDNILFQGRYVDMLSVIKPDVFLVSGGGNDLLGDHKIGILARGLKQNRHEAKVQAQPGYIYVEKLPGKYLNRADEDMEEGVKYLTKEFFGFVNIFQWQYYYLFRSIRHKYKVMPIMTQGYDFALPDSRIDKAFFSVTYWYQHYLNEIMGKGDWIEIALRDAEIYDTNTMQKVVKTMIHIFNEMLIETGSAFEHVYHIDSRGLAKPYDWFDEIHLKNNRFLQVANTYYRAMNSALAKKAENNDCPRIFWSKDTKATIRFWEQFSAFWPDTFRTNKPWIVYTLVSLVILVGIVIWFAKRAWFGEFIRIVGMIVLVFKGVPLLRRLLRSIVLSWHYTTHKYKTKPERKRWHD